MIKKTPVREGNKIRVTFEFPGFSRTRSVHLVGSFNDWNETATPMVRKGRAGAWRVQMELERGQEYRFRYLVDGESWHNDWHADRYEPNIHGSDDSVVVT